MASSSDRSAGRGMLRTAGTRGVVTGVVIAVLGLWSVLVPLVGPYFGYALSPAGPWTTPWAALWLQIVPGVVLLLCGVVLTLTRVRVLGLVAGVLAAAAGVWLAVGFALWPWAPGGGARVGGVAATDGVSAAEQIGMAGGLGAVVTLLAGLAIGRFSVRGTRDVGAAQRHESDRRRSSSEPDRTGPTGSSDRGPAAGDTAVPAPRPPEDHRARRPTDA
jgi:hypothetical protein